MYALSLHSVTRGYEYSRPAFLAPEDPGNRLRNIRLIPHDPNNEQMLTSFLGSATRNVDLIDLSTATPEQIQQLQLQSTFLISQGFLRSNAAANRHQDQYLLGRRFAARSQERQLSKDFNVVVVGARGVSKSALVLHFITSKFVNEYDPTVEDSYRRAITVDGIPAVVDVLDTTGQEEYSAMREQYMKTGEGFVLLYSISSRESFAEIFKFHEQISNVRKTRDYPRIIVANHCERDFNQVSELEGKAMAEELQCPSLKASSTTGVNVDSVFETLVREIRYHDAMGTVRVEDSGSSDPVEEEAEPFDRLLQDGAKSKRPNDYFRGRLKRGAK